MITGNILLRTNYFIQFTISIFLINLFFNATPPPIDLEIVEIQGVGNVSPFENEMVTLTNNVVTVVTGDRFYMQSTSNNTDNNPTNSDGIVVYVGDSPNVQIGDIVTVEGIVDEFNDVTTIDDNSLVVTVISSNATLPAPILFDENFPGKESQAVHDLESVEAMYIEIKDAFITAPTSEFNFLTVTAGTQRPFREAGIKYPGIPGLPVWDGNPEVFEFDMFFQNIPILAAGSKVSAIGIMSHGFFGDYEFVAVEADFTLINTTINARERNEDEVSIGCINGLFLNSDANRVQT